MRARTVPDPAEVVSAGSVMVGAVLLLVAVLFLVTALRQAALARRWPSVGGTVVELRFVNDLAEGGAPAARVFRVRARYRTPDGQERTAWSGNRVRMPLDAVGAPVDVSYDPHRPDRVLVGRPSLPWYAVVAAVALAAGGAFFLAAGLR